VSPHPLEPNPAANRRRALGCLVAFFGMVLLTIVPALGNYVDIEPSFAYLLLAIAVVLLFVGAGVSIVLGGRSER
jgi:polyferredoxin